MGLVNKVLDFEQQFKQASCQEDKEKILNQFKGFSMVEQGLEDVPKTAQDVIWDKAKSEAFYDTFVDIGTYGRQYKEGYLHS